MEDQTRQYQQIIAKSWADENFKNQLLADPVTTLQAEGIEIPAGITVNAVADTTQSMTLVIPAKPADLSDEDLETTVGGYCATGCCTVLL